MNDPSILRNTIYVDFNDKNLDNVRFVKVNCLSAVREHLTPKVFVDEAYSYEVDESSISRLNLDEKLKLDEQDVRSLNSSFTSPITIIEIPTKPYVDSLNENSRK